MCVVEKDRTAQPSASPQFMQARRGAVRVHVRVRVPVPVCVRVRVRVRCAVLCCANCIVRLLYPTVLCCAYVAQQQCTAAMHSMSNGD